MWNFLRKCILFLLLPGLYFGGNFLYNRYVYQHSAVAIESRRILIVGDSHTQKSLDPAIFGEANNVSQQAEPYILTYWKVKKILTRYKPDTLIIGFAPHNISAFNDLKFSNPMWSSEMFKRCYTMEKLQTLDGLIPLDVARYYREIFKQTAIYPQLNHIHYLGKYLSSTSSRPTNAAVALARHYQFDGLDYTVSRLSVRCLDSLLILCREENILPVLVNSPIHKTYRDNIPIDILKEYQAISKRLRNAGCTVIDLELSYPDSLFYDSDHLNSFGATRFSRAVAKEMRGH